MKHYVLGFIFNNSRDKVLLIQKKRPEWQKDRWNGIGGKIELEIPLCAIVREALEETGHQYPFKHKITFICPGGTVFVFAAILNQDLIPYTQIEDEELKVWNLEQLPKNIMSNLKWIIPICLSTIQFPLLILDNSLGVE